MTQQELEPQPIITRKLLWLAPKDAKFDDSAKPHHENFNTDDDYRKTMAQAWEILRNEKDVKIRRVLRSQLNQAIKNLRALKHMKSRYVDLKATGEYENESNNIFSRMCN